MIARFLSGLGRVFAAAAIAAAASTAFAAAGKPLPPDSVYQLALPLTDQAGRTADWRGLRGKPRVVSMFYTSCQYICPLIVDSGKAIEHQLTAAERGRIGIVLISMDPARDTPAALRKVFDKRGLDANRWSLASPPPADVRSVAALLGIRYRRLADGEFNHTSALVLLDAEGRIVARTEQVGSKPDPAFVAAVRKAAAR
ncbi:SCO family protein [Thermomonas carbonis]|uniref:SCO family protein n=1 Tax=Thermomonas carbonis TaxID=1463158 RepID=A0A7G9SQG7_9GAMM|nr:SCO family protein [Thermomonas carbonis]QNN70092.1 SCO family protein [Thermomonas carbonis]GHB97704.1 SCO family protein [Thermomonas carbonis]